MDVLLRRKKQTQIMILLALVLFAFAINLRVPSTFNGVTAHVVKSNSLGKYVNSCQDFDHGINLYESSYVVYGDKYYYDSCMDNGIKTYSGNYVVENYCYDDKHMTSVKYCANSCESGKCL